MLLVKIEMEKRVKFNQLVANCVMLQNVLDMSQALRELIEEGYPVTMKAVQGLSAYPHGHVQRYGEYGVPGAVRQKTTFRTGCVVSATKVAYR